MFVVAAVFDIPCNYFISPEKSHVSKEFAAGDAEFWTPKAPAPGKSTMRKSGKSKWKQ